MSPAMSPAKETEEPGTPASNTHVDPTIVARSPSVNVTSLPTDEPRHPSSYPSATSSAASAPPIIPAASTETPHMPPRVNMAEAKSTSTAGRVPFSVSSSTSSVSHRPLPDLVANDARVRLISDASTAAPVTPSTSPKPAKLYSLSRAIREHIDYDDVHADVRTWIEGKDNEQICRQCIVKILEAHLQRRDATNTFGVLVDQGLDLAHIAVNGGPGFANTRIQQTLRALRAESKMTESTTAGISQPDIAVYCASNVRSLNTKSNTPSSSKVGSAHSNSLGPESRNSSSSGPHSLSLTESGSNKSGGSKRTRAGKNPSVRSVRQKRFAIDPIAQGFCCCSAVIESKVLLILKGFCQLSCYVLAAWEMSACRLAMFTYREQYSRVFVLDDKTIVVETGNADTETPPHEGVSIEKIITTFAKKPQSLLAHSVGSMRQIGDKNEFDIHHEAVERLLTFGRVSASMLTGLPVSGESRDRLVDCWKLQTVGLTTELDHVSPSLDGSGSVTMPSRMLLDRMHEGPAPVSQTDNSERERVIALMMARPEQLRGAGLRRHPDLTSVVRQATQQTEIDDSAASSSARSPPDDEDKGGEGGGRGEDASGGQDQHEDQARDDQGRTDREPDTQGPTGGSGTEPCDDECAHDIETDSFSESLDSSSSVRSADAETDDESDDPDPRPEASVVFDPHYHAILRSNIKFALVSSAVMDRLLATVEQSNSNSIRLQEAREAIRRAPGTTEVGKGDLFSPSSASPPQGMLSYP